MSRLSLAAARTPHNGTVSLVTFIASAVYSALSHIIYFISYIIIYPIIYNILYNIFDCRWAVTRWQSRTSQKIKGQYFLFLSDSNQTQVWPKGISTKATCKNVMKVPPLVAESFYVDGRTHRHDEANRCLSPLLCERARTGSLIKNI